jgi:hypothetical protein
MASCKGFKKPIMLWSDLGSVKRLAKMKTERQSVTAVLVISLSILSAESMRTWFFAKEETAQANDFFALCLCMGCMVAWQQVISRGGFSWTQLSRTARNRKEHKKPEARGNVPGGQDINEPPEVWKRRQHYQKDLEKCSKNGKYKTAQALIEDMRREGIEPCATCHLYMVLSCIKGDQIRLADGWFEKLLHPGVGHGAGAYYGHVVVETCIHAGDPKRAIAWFEQLIASGAKLGNRTLSIVLEALIKRRQAREAEAFFEQLLNTQYPMDVACWQGMLEAIALMKDHAK